MYAIAFKNDYIQELLQFIWRGRDVQQLINHHQSTHYQRNLSVISHYPTAYINQIFGCFLLLVVIIVFVSVKNYSQRRRAREDKLKSASKSKCKSKCESAGGSTADSSEESDDMVETVIDDFYDINFEDDISLHVSPKCNSECVLLLTEEKQTEMV